MTDPALDYEQAIAEEFQESVTLSHSNTDYQHATSSSKKDNVREEITERDDTSSENSPLLVSRGNAPGRPPHARASASYMKAINEPWNGAYGHADRPWYKKPSVCISRLLCSPRS